MEAQSATPAATLGSNGANPSLAGLRTEVRQAERTLEKLSAHMTHAESVLQFSNRQLAAQQEATRLKELSGLGTIRVEIAQQIDQVVNDLETLTNEYDGVGNAMLRLIPQTDDTARLKMNGQGRLHLLFATKLRDLDIQTNRSDPRFGQSLSEMEWEALTDFIMSDNVAMKRAMMKVAVE